MSFEGVVAVEFADETNGFFVGQKGGPPIEPRDVLRLGSVATRFIC